MRGSLEGSITKEPGGVVELRLFPGLLVEVLVVVVNEDDGVGGHGVAAYLGVSVGDVRHDGGAGGADSFPECGLQEHQLGLLGQSELLAWRQTALYLLSQPPLDSRSGGEVYQDPGRKVGDGAVAAQHVLQGEQRVLQVHGVFLVLAGRTVSQQSTYQTISYFVVLIRFDFLQKRIQKIFVSRLPI